MNSEPILEADFLKEMIGAHLYQAVPAGALESLGWDLLREVERFMLWEERDEAESWCVTHLRGFQRLAWRWIWSWEEPTVNEMLEEEMFRLAGMIEGQIFRIREIDGELERFKETI